MNIRLIAGTTLVAAGVLGMATLGQAAAPDVEITIAPPADRVEVVPEPRKGFVYERGHYEYDGHAYQWKEGRFLQERQGHVYTPYALEHRGDKYYYRPGHWDDDG
jgi:hypothetical protein